MPVGENGRRPFAFPYLRPRVNRTPAASKPSLLHLLNLRRNILWHSRKPPRAFVITFTITRPPNYDFTLEFEIFGSFFHLNDEFGDTAMSSVSNI